MRNLTGFVVGCVIFLLLTQTASAQQRQEIIKCPLVREQSPVIRGLKLGMTSAEVEQLFAPESPSSNSQDLAQRTVGIDAVRTDDIGSGSQYILNSRIFPIERLKGIRSIDLRYLDDTVASFTIRYDDSVKWQSDLHFAAAIAEQLHLPTKGWQGRILPRLTCDGFYIEVTAIGNSLHIERTDYNEEVLKRIKAREQRKRVEFKP